MGIEYLFENNRRWAAAKTERDPEFFHRRANLQTPAYLWIGCSDSRVAADTVLGLDPGEVFVHRNVANLVVPSDLNLLSALQFAVEMLKVRHVIVCGHYGCGGIKAVLRQRELGLIDNWLHSIKYTIIENHQELDSLDKDARLSRLCELNVVAQVRNVAATTIVQDAWARGQAVSVHGWIYSLEDGLLRDLKCTHERPEDLDVSLRFDQAPDPDA